MKGGQKSLFYWQSIRRYEKAGRPCETSGSGWKNKASGSSHPPIRRCCIETTGTLLSDRPSLLPAPASGWPVRQEILCHGLSSLLQSHLSILDRMGQIGSWMCYAQDL